MHTRATLYFVQLKTSNTVRCCLLRLPEYTQQLASEHTLVWGKDGKCVRRSEILTWWCYHENLLYCQNTISQHCNIITGVRSHQILGIHITQHTENTIF